MKVFVTKDKFELLVDEGVSDTEVYRALNALLMEFNERKEK